MVKLRELYKNLNAGYIANFLMYMAQFLVGLAVYTLCSTVIPTVFYMMHEEVPTWQNGMYAIMAELYTTYLLFPTYFIPLLFFLVFSGVVYCFINVKLGLRSMKACVTCIVYLVVFQWYVFAWFAVNTTMGYFDIIINGLFASIAVIMLLPIFNGVRVALRPLPELFKIIRSSLQKKPVKEA